MKKIIPVTLCFIFFAATAAFPETLDIQTAIKKTLQNSWPLRNSLLDTKIADDRIQTAKDVYKPTFISDLQHTYSETGANVLSPVPSTETGLNEWNNTISKMFENGFSGSLTASLREIETSVPALTTLDDSRQNLIFSLSYPLLKNRGGRTLQYPAQIAGFGKNIAELQYEFLTESEILHTTVAFYQVCLAYEEKKAVLSNIEGAEAVAETMKRRYELGTSEAKDLLRTQAAVSAQKTRLIVVNNGLAKSKINLLKAMGEKNLSQPYECDYDLSTTLSHIDSKTNILFSAITRRKDLQQLEYRIKIADKTIALEEDSKAANLDIITSYATDGLGGNNAFSESETPAWMLGLAYKKKFGGETKVSETIKEKEKLENSMEDYKAMIAEEIFTAVEDVNHLLAALTEAGNLHDIQSRRLAEEEKDFDLGRTSVRDIEEARDDLTSSQLILVQARINVIRAYANLLFVSGELDQNFYAKLK